jgi:hypothetical protein
MEESMSPLNFLAAPPKLSRNVHEIGIGREKRPQSRHMMVIPRLLERIYRFLYRVGVGLSRMRLRRQHRDFNS